MNKKSTLRSHFKMLRRQFSPLERKELHRALVHNIERFVRDFSSPQTQVCLYRAKPDEALCELKNLTRYFFPRITAEKIEFFRPGSPNAFENNAFKITEPIPSESQVLDKSLPMIVFCPALSVDIEGHRLGTGGGFYDRFFKSHPRALRVAVVYHQQLSTSSLQREEWDQDVDWIITDQMIFQTRIAGKNPVRSA